MGFFTRLIAGLVAASTLGAGWPAPPVRWTRPARPGTRKASVKLASDDTRRPARTIW